MNPAHLRTQKARILHTIKQTKQALRNHLHDNLESYKNSLTYISSKLKIGREYKFDLFYILNKHLSNVIEHNDRLVDENICKILTDYTHIRNNFNFHNAVMCIFCLKSLKNRIEQNEKISLVNKIKNEINKNTAVNSMNIQNDWQEEIKCIFDTKEECNKDEITNYNHNVIRNYKSENKLKIEGKDKNDSGSFKNRNTVCSDSDKNHNEIFEEPFNEYLFDNGFNVDEINTSFCDEQKEDNFEVFIDIPHNTITFMKKEVIFSCISFQTHNINLIEQIPNLFSRPFRLNIDLLEMKYWCFKKILNTQFYHYGKYDFDLDKIERLNSYKLTRSRGIYKLIEFNHIINNDFYEYAENKINHFFEQITTKYRNEKIVGLIISYFFTINPGLIEIFRVSKYRNMAYYYFLRWLDTN